MRKFESKELQATQIILTMLTALLADDLSDISLTEESEDDETSTPCNDIEKSILDKHGLLETTMLPPSLDHASSVANSVCATTADIQLKISSDQNLVDDSKTFGIKNQCFVDNFKILGEPPVSTQPSCPENATTNSEGIVVAMSSSSSSSLTHVDKLVAHAPSTANADAKTAETNVDDGGKLKLQNINPVSKRALSEKESRLYDIPKQLMEAHRDAVVLVPTTFMSKAKLDAFVFDNVLSSDECRFLIQQSEKSGYSFWNESQPNAKDFRDAFTVEVNHPQIASLLWERLKQPLLAAMGQNTLQIPDDETYFRWQCDLVGEWVPVGTNHSVLFGKYNPGGHFAPHTDGYSIIDFNFRSMYSIVLYLNDVSGGGGGTRFYSDDQRGKLQYTTRWEGQPEHVLGTVQPKAGRAAVFFHNHMHEGVPPLNGSSKYIIRSDVMFRRIPSVCTLPCDKQAFKLYQQANSLSGEGSAIKAMELLRQCFDLSPALADIYRI